MLVISGEYSREYLVGLLLVFECLPVVTQQEVGVGNSLVAVGHLDVALPK